MATEDRNSHRSGVGSSGMHLPGGEVRVATAAKIDAVWVQLIKRVIARYARGNTAAQQARILLPEEQDAQRERAHKIIEGWKSRRKHATP